MTIKPVMPTYMSDVYRRAFGLCMSVLLLERGKTHGPAEYEIQYQKQQSIVTKTSRHEPDLLATSLRSLALKCCGFAWSAEDVKLRLRKTQEKTALPAVL